MQALGKSRYLLVVTILLTTMIGGYKSPALAQSFQSMCVVFDTDISEWATSRDSFQVWSAHPCAGGQFIETVPAGTRYRFSGKSASHEGTLGSSIEYTLPGQTEVKHGWRQLGI